MKLSVQLESNGLTLRGYLEQPEIINERLPTVIMFHGLTGNFSEDNFLFTTISKELCDLGYCTVRFDFAHSGESDGLFENMTISSEINDARNILEFTRNLPKVDPDRIAILGYSLGGYVGSIVAGEQPEKVKCLILLAPAGNLPKLLNSFFVNKEHYADIGGLNLSRQALIEAYNTNVYDLARGFLGNVLIVHGDGDKIVPLRYSYKFKEIYHDLINVVVLDCGHTFERVMVRTKLLLHITSFLKKNL